MLQNGDKPSMTPRIHPAPEPAETTCVTPVNTACKLFFVAWDARGEAATTTAEIPPSGRRQP
ncbi:MAG: hypothetical protein ACKN9T_04680 [Candidatus Methylumidiphilus sp.]